MSMDSASFCQSDRHRAVLQRSARLAEQFAADAAQYDATATFPSAHFAALQANGYLGMTVPQAYGGEGEGVLAMVLAQERLAQGDPSTALAVGWHLSQIGKQAHCQSWPEPVRTAVFRAAAETGALINAVATEPETGSPNRGGLPTTQAVRLPDGRWRLDGRKSFATMAPALRFFLLSATVAESGDLGWFLVERNTPGLQIDETWNALGMRATCSHDLIVSDLTLPSSALVETRSQRSRVPTDGWNLHVPAVYLGIAQAARNFAIRYAQEREIAGVGALATQPKVKEQIGRMELALLPARTLLFTLAQRWDEEPEQRASLTPSVAACKVAVVEAAMAVVDLAMRLAGGSSLSRRLPLERYYRDVRAGLHNPPMEDVALAQLAAQALAEAERESKG